MYDYYRDLLPFSFLLKKRVINKQETNIRELWIVVWLKSGYQTVFSSNTIIIITGIRDKLDLSTNLQYISNHYCQFCLNISGVFGMIYHKCLKAKVKKFRLENKHAFCTLSFKFL